MSDEHGLLGGHIAPLRAKREDVWQDMLSVIHDEEPAYTRFATPEEEAEHGESVLRLFDLFLELAEAGRHELTPMEEEAIRATGATRADQRFTFPMVRASVRAAVGVARAYIVEEYAPSGPEDKAAMGRVLAFLDWYGNRVEDLLHEGLEARVKDRAAHGRTELADLVVDVEGGAVTEDAEFARRVKTLGCDATVARGMVLLPDTRAGAAAASALKQQLSGATVLPRPQAATPHVLVLASVPVLDRWPAVLAVVQATAAQAGVTAVAVEPCQTVAEHQDRYAAAVVLVPFLGRLAEGRAVLDAASLTPYSVAASLSSRARRWLRRDVLRGLDADRKLLRFLRSSIACKFVLNAVERETGWEIKTVRRYRTKLEGVTGRKYADVADQAILVLAYCAAVLDA